MAISALKQTENPERRRFTWEKINGSIYVVNEGSGWGYISVSNDQTSKIHTWKARRSPQKPARILRNLEQCKSVSISRSSIPSRPTVQIRKLT